MKLLAVALRSGQRAIEAIHHRQERLDRFGQRVFAELKLLARVALAEIVELRLQARQPVEQRVALLAQTFELFLLRPRDAGRFRFLVLGRRQLALDVERRNWPLWH